MAFLEDVVAQLVSNSSAADNSVEGLLGSLFRGTRGWMNSTGVGGLEGLVARFDDAGLGLVVESWIGAGPKLPMTPEMVRAVLGDSAVTSIAKAAGRDEHEMLVELAQLLPDAIAKRAHQQAK